MSSNFLIDFAFFEFIGIISGLDWQMAFILATGAACVTRYGTMLLMHQRVKLYGVRKHGNHDALPGTMAAKRDARRK